MCKYFEKIVYHNLKIFYCIDTFVNSAKWQVKVRKSISRISRAYREASALTCDGPHGSVPDAAPRIH